MTVEEQLKSFNYDNRNDIRVFCRFENSPYGYEEYRFSNWNKEQVKSITFGKQRPTMFDPRELHFYIDCFGTE